MNSRRREMFSEASTVGTTTSSLRADIVDSLQLLNLLDDDDFLPFDDGSTPQQQLGRLLSKRSAISTTSSFAEEQQKAVDAIDENYRLIGWGACGVIYTRDGSSQVLKLAKTDDKQLWTDYLMNTRVWEAMARIPDLDGQIYVPQPNYYVPKAEETWWSKNRPFFPETNSACNFPTAVLCTQRILPLPFEIRRRLIEIYCPQQYQAKAFQSPGNRDCLVRLYLGSRQDRRPRGLFFSLRNFKLHLNQMQEIEMPVLELAGRMGGALAAMHWGAKIDARDVEFVLGSAPTQPLIKPLSSADLEEIEPDTYTELQVCRKANFLHRTVHLWVLDFNQCRKISMDEDGVLQAVEAFFINDPYYPRPPRNDTPFDRDLWTAFVMRYLSVAQNILLSEAEEVRSLPLKFLQEVVKEQVRKDKRKEEAATASASASVQAP